MTKLEVFDPAMCCTTGVCGPHVDPALARFEADLRWLGTQGAEVTRHNLGQEPGAFAGSDVVRTVLQTGGEDVLPVVLVDGSLRWTGHYPTRDELAATLPSAGLITPPGDQSCCAPGDQSANKSGDACCAPADRSAGQTGEACCTPTLQVDTAPAAGTAGGCCS